MTDYGAAPWLALALGYLLGSIPFGLLLTRAAGYGDIRDVGSGNIGATNVLRTGHRGLAALTLVLDAAKGAAAVFAAHEIGGRYWGIAILASLLAGLGAVLGHMFPVWLKFRGGKGVATYIGVLAAVHWPSALIMCGGWLAMAAVTRYSSLSALIASAATPFVLWAFGERADALLFAILTLLLIAKHRENIRRLLEGREPKIGAKA